MKTGASGEVFCVGIDYVEEKGVESGYSIDESVGSFDG